MWTVVLAAGLEGSTLCRCFDRCFAALPSLAALAHVYWISLALFLHHEVLRKFRDHAAGLCPDHFGHAAEMFWYLLLWPACSSRGAAQLRSFNDQCALSCFSISVAFCVTTTTHETPAQKPQNLVSSIPKVHRLVMGAALRTRHQVSDPEGGSRQLMFRLIGCSVFAHFTWGRTGGALRTRLWCPLAVYKKSGPALDCRQQVDLKAVRWLLEHLGFTASVTRPTRRSPLGLRMCPGHHAL